MAHKNMKRCSISLVLKEMQINYSRDVYGIFKLFHNVLHSVIIHLNYENVNKIIYDCAKKYDDFANTKGQNQVIM